MDVAGPAGLAVSAKGWPTMGRDRAGRGQADARSAQGRGKTPTGMEEWGRELRRLREARGWSQAELAARMFCDDSVVSRLETGTLAPTAKTAQAADEALGLPESLASLREILLNLGGGQWAGDIAELEKRATLLNLWDPCYLPGLLQTEPYMREVFLAAEPDATDVQIEQRVAERLARQEIWQRADPPPPMLHAVIWEPALRVPVGGMDTMRAQLKYLAEAVASNRRVRIQVLPLSHGANPGMSGAFVVANFADERPAAVLDNLLLGQMTEKRTDVARLSLLFARLASDAMNPQVSMELIEKVAGEWNS
jgi:transcriptional regulator with XRE-family HTH domain